MILDENYEKMTIRSYVNLKCDYCGKKFQRVKKSIPKLNVHVNKDSCGDKACTLAKKEEVNLKLHGKKCIFETDEFKEKHPSYFNDPAFANKRKESMKEKYGVENPLQNESIRKKQQNTCKKLYGVENYSHHSDFIPKCIATSLEKYGSEYYSQTDEFIKKCENTCLEKYGVKYYMQTEEGQTRKKNTCLSKFGHEYYSQTSECKLRYKETCLSKFGVVNPLLLNKKYGITQKEIEDWINSLGFSFSENHSILDGKEIDLYDSNIKMAIEYCGIYWHNELSPNPRFRNYHASKYKICKEKGINLITIFEDEWIQKQEQCMSIIKSKLGLHNKIFARKCEIKEIAKKDAKKFYDKNHLLGSPPNTIISYSLIYNEEVIGVISLGKHHRNNDNVVLNRLCFKLNTSVIGGFSKLLKQCIKYCKENNIKEILSWSDNRWYEGNSYSKVGFILDKEFGPDYSYVNIRSSKAIRYSKQSFKKSNKSIPENITEREWCVQNGFGRIWDCGKKRWKLVIPY